MANEHTRKGNLTHLGHTLPPPTSPTRVCQNNHPWDAHNPTKRVQFTWKKSHSHFDKRTYYKYEKKHLFVWMSTKIRAPPGWGPWRDLFICQHEELSSHASGFLKVYFLWTQSEWTPATATTTTMIVVVVKLNYFRCSDLIFHWRF